MPIEIGPRAAVHLLNRIGFGPRPGDVDRILGMGLDRYVQSQLDASVIRYLRDDRPSKRLIG